MPDLRFGESRATYEIMRCDRKTLGVMISPDGAVVVRAPYNASIGRISDFVDRLKPWIFKHLARYRQACPRLKFITGESLPYLGKKYRLKVVNDDTNGSRTQLSGSRLRVTVPGGLEDEGRSQAVRHALEDWYRAQAQALLPLRVSELALRLNVLPGKVGIKRQVRRWGSCSASGNIALNWKLIMAPPSVTDYVVIHELCHLKVRNHQPEFWALVALHQPDYKKLRKWLRVNGRRMTLL